MSEVRVHQRDTEEGQESFGHVKAPPQEKKGSKTCRVGGDPSLCVSAPADASLGSKNGGGREDHGRAERGAQQGEAEVGASKCSALIEQKASRGKLWAALGVDNSCGHCGNDSQPKRAWARSACRVFTLSSCHGLCEQGRELLHLGDLIVCDFPVLFQLFFLSRCVCFHAHVFAVVYSCAVES